MSRVMELPENGLEHWKAKFIDGLPPLFAERVKKTLRTPQGAIPYGAFTYGKQTKHRETTNPNPTSDKPYSRKRSRRRSREEREERRSRHKSDRFTRNRSRRELAKIKCYKCGKFGHISPNCKLEKLKALELDEEVHDKIYSFLYTSRSESDYDSNTESENDGNRSKSSKPTTNGVTNACKCNGDICSCEDDEFFYKLQSQFEDLNIQTITSENVIELLKEVTDNDLHD
ncbi:hypothetical protein KY290_030964 [Solanum tuberosum]|uniref:CCHC-type domain-containing protein n=1 Tax=Solanum tuberosum TaxID=4113 RepID=A0ABQ7U815_SOLTU|nr:hypothetical protein KY290_030964 [Solanum tuberosum]